MHTVQLSSFDLNLLVVLDALLETRSVKKAAARVSLSPSAVSHALSRLRDALADPLLVRAGRQLVLTPRAEGIRPRVHRALEELTGALRFEETLIPEQLQRTFRIAATDYAELIALGPISDALSRTAPGVTLQSQVLGADAAERLRANDYELALGVFFTLPDDIRRRSLLHEEFVCVLRRGHPALKRKLTLERYASLSHVLVSPRGGPRGVVDEFLEREGTSRRVARTVASFFAAPRLVAGTDYVLTLPERVARQLAADLDLVIRRPPVPLTGFDLELVWHRRYDDDPAHRWLRDSFAASP